MKLFHLRLSFGEDSAQHWGIECYVEAFTIRVAISTALEQYPSAYRVVEAREIANGIVRAASAQEHK